MERITDQRGLSADEAEPEIVLKRKIFEKLAKRFSQPHLPDASCAELNPDVIVISADQTMIFESQNERASAILRQKCGWVAEAARSSERICVHPSQSQRLIETLSAVGLKIAQ